MDGIDDDKADVKSLVAAHLCREDIGRWKYTEAEALKQETLAIKTMTLGDAHPSTL